MSRRRRSSAAETPVEQPDRNRLRPIWLFGLTALCVATPILPTETVMFGGSAFVLMLLWWLLLIGWAVSGLVRGRLECRLGPATWAWLALLVWHSTSALVMAGHGQPRATWNMLWQWISFGTAFFLARQLLISAAERRAIVAVFIGLAVSLAAVGYFQRFYEFPADLEQYQQDPDKALRGAGVVAPPGSSQRKTFEDRLNSTEPFATFALTNSLAGFLAAWLIVAIGILVTNWSAHSTSRWMSIAIGVAVVVILGCLVLTKSRTAWVATFTGFGLLFLYGRRAGWRPDWKIVAGIGAGVVVLPLLGIVFGGLDRLVVLESSKSLQYRLQYWQSTARLIADFPWFGCGPGNFQQYYTAYKLPEASETIAEPHNFLLEVWATAGTPAAILLLAIFAGIAWQVWRAEARGQHREVANSQGTVPKADPLEDSSVASIYWGAAVGALVAYVACAYLEGYFPSPGFLFLGLPAAAGLLVILRRWIAAGQLSSAVVAIALVVMLVNFVAAGGIGFAGVVQSLWLLAAILLNEVEASSRQPVEHEAWILGRRGALVFTAIVTLLLVGFHRTTFSPVNRSQAFVIEAMTRRGIGQLVPALEAYFRAAVADPYSPEPWEEACQLANAMWLQSGERTYEGQFRVAAQEALNHNRRSSATQMLVGNHWLQAYRRFGKKEYLELALDHYGIAVKLYPNYNLGHAQYAWALHLAANKSAPLEVDEALRLDGLNPHQEQKLAGQRLFDVNPADRNQPASAADRSAEQVLLGLRK